MKASAGRRSCSANRDEPSWRNSRWRTGPTGAGKIYWSCWTAWIQPSKSYRQLAMRREKGIAKVAMGRRLGVRLYWMWRNGLEYSQSIEFGSHAGELVTGHGVN